MHGFGLLLWSVGLTLSLAKLLAVQTVSRHGTRAPNEEYFPLCPNDQNQGKWPPVAWGGLTGMGMQSMHDLGELMRNLYVLNETTRLLDPSTFVLDQFFLQSNKSPRCQQSALAMASALFPVGSAVTGYDYAPPVPYTWNEKDDLLECDKNECKKLVKSMEAKFQSTAGAAMVAAQMDLVNKVSTACGVDLANNTIEDVFDSIKDVNDGFLFDQEAGFPPPDGLDAATLAAFSSFAWGLLDAMEHTTAQELTGFTGQLPQTILDNFNDTLLPPDAEGATVTRVWSYHGHRHLLYAMAAVFGIDFSFLHPTSTPPLGSSPPGTTIFFEVHDDSVSPSWDTAVVRTFVWTRCDVSDPRPKVCPRYPVILAKCGSGKELDCPLKAFETIYKDLATEAGGTWETVCNVTESL